jgi:hypothetical protein
MCGLLLSRVKALQEDREQLARHIQWSKDRKGRLSVYFDRRPAGKGGPDSCSRPARLLRKLLRSWSPTR